jgi:hypothetical protein
MRVNETHMPVTGGATAKHLALIAAMQMGAALQAQTPPHLLNAEALVVDLGESALTAPHWPNVYGLPASITWNGPLSTARTECSSFATLLLEHTYGWTPQHFQAWMGSISPDAARYHDAIAAQHGFQLISNIADVLPGDFIAIVYYPEYQSPSGHVMLVQGPPQSHSSKPYIAGTQQWIVPVIDSTSTCHGATDTRYTHPGGIGEGIFRIYTDANDEVTGCTWSLLGTSLGSYYPQSVTKTTGHHLVIGRLVQ